MTLSRSARAQAAYSLVQSLQTKLLHRLTDPADIGRFEPAQWLRDDGRHGGGTRLTYAGGERFNRASLNVSHVHYDDLSERPLGSASALSSIVHPAYPHAPSLHLHISWTEMKAGDGYWRLMADLNPSIRDEADAKRFLSALKDVCGAHFDEGIKQGDRYFHIPALSRHRGVAHFYLEQFRAEDTEFPRCFGEAMIDAYGDILRDKFAAMRPPSAEAVALQRAYHTAYLFQVLTLDRGTTSGLLVHDQNDLGILGSLPAVIDRALLASWEPSMPKPQDELLRSLVQAVPASGVIGDAEKQAFCRVLRGHYARHPQALDLQARGDILPPTVANHDLISSAGGGSAGGGRSPS